MYVGDVNTFVYLCMHAHIPSYLAQIPFYLAGNMRNSQK